MRTQNMVADILTKALPYIMHAAHASNMRGVQFPHDWQIQDAQLPWGVVLAQRGLSWDEAAIFVSGRVGGRRHVYSSTSFVSCLRR